MDLWVYCWGHGLVAPNEGATQTWGNGLACLPMCESPWISISPFLLPFSSLFFFLPFSLSVKWDDASCSVPGSIKHIMVVRVVIFIIKRVQGRGSHHFPLPSSLDMWLQLGQNPRLPWETQHHARRLHPGHLFPPLPTSPRNRSISNSALGNPGQQMRVKCLLSAKGFLRACSMDFFKV